MVDFIKALQRQRAQERQRESEQAGTAAATGRITTSPIRINLAGNDYSVKFDVKLLDGFKRAIPDHDRRWVKDRYLWLVAPESIQIAKQFFEEKTGQQIIVPFLSTAPAPILGKTFLLEYLAVTKSRGDKRRTAYGYVNGDWNAEFPEDVLRAFFEGTPNRGEKATTKLQTLYQVLCIPEASQPEQIKSAYRRLARQWHPDVCKEDNATEMFRKINEAYLILIDPEKRRRYDAGLYFERQGQEQGYTTKIVTRPVYGYRSPLRCGTVTAIGIIRLMRFVVQEITIWEDVVREDGKVMCTQWPARAKEFQVLWV